MEIIPVTLSIKNTATIIPIKKAIVRRFHAFPLTMKINGRNIPVIWEDNESVQAIKEQASKSPVTVDMSMYGGFEQVGSLGRSYPSQDTWITSHNGDIVLYSGNQIVMFYGSNTWAYTRLGKVDLPENEVTSLLGNGNITLTISVE